MLALASGQGGGRRSAESIRVEFSGSFQPTLTSIHSVPTPYSVAGWAVAHQIPDCSLPVPNGLPASLPPGIWLSRPGNLSVMRTSGVGKRSGDGGRCWQVLKITSQDALHLAEKHGAWNSLLIPDCYILRGRGEAKGISTSPGTGGCN